MTSTGIPLDQNMRFLTALLLQILEVPAYGPAILEPSPSALCSQRNFSERTRMPCPLR